MVRVELCVEEMVIWTFVPLVKSPSGDEMLSPPRSFSGSLMSIN